MLLLDEFEKAAPAVWDIFLQVFDDGRLTDRNGRTVDLRHCVIILTSNLGSAIPTGPGVGFGGRSGGFEPGTVLKSVGRSFRPEFLNRLDRVVVFRPLGREMMRGLLEKELNSVLRPARLPHAAVGRGVGRGRRRLPDRAGVQRRAGRPAAQAGRGAAPADAASPGRSSSASFPRATSSSSSRREKERALTSRSSIRIARRQEPPVAPPAAAARPHRGRRRARTARDRRPRRRTCVPSSIAGGARPELGGRRSGGAGGEARDPAFWQSEERHDVLSRIEYLDRLGAATAPRLSVWRATVSGREAHSRELVRLLARRLHVLDAALARPRRRASLRTRRSWCEPPRGRLAGGWRRCRAGAGDDVRRAGRMAGACASAGTMSRTRTGVDGRRARRVHVAQAGERDSTCFEVPRGEDSGSSTASPPRDVAPRDHETRPGEADAAAAGRADDRQALPRESPSPLVRRRVGGADRQDRPRARRRLRPRRRATGA